MPPFNCSSAAAANTTAPAAEARWLYAALAVIPLWIVFGNLLVMLAVLLQRNLHTLSSRVIASLAVTDFLLALCVVPLGIYQLVSRRPTGHSLFKLYYCMPDDVPIFRDKLYFLILFVLFLIIF